MRIQWECGTGGCFVYMSGVEMMESELSLYSMYYNKCVWYTCTFVYINSLRYHEMGGMNGVNGMGRS